MGYTCSHINEVVATLDVLVSGSLNEPSLDAAAFIPCIAFTSIAGRRLYLDLVVYTQPTTTANNTPAKATEAKAAKTFCVVVSSETALVAMFCIVDVVSIAVVSIAVVNIVVSSETALVAMLCIVDVVSVACDDVVILCVVNVIIAARIQQQ